MTSFSRSGELVPFKDEEDLSLAWPHKGTLPRNQIRTARLFLVSGCTVLASVLLLLLGLHSWHHKRITEVPHVGQTRPFNPNLSLELELATGLDRLRHEKHDTTNRQWQKRIWQTWKSPVGLAAKRETWQRLNPAWRYEVRLRPFIDGRRLTRVPQLLLDEAAETLVEEVYGDVSPLVVNTYKNYAPPVLKADLLRYLLLYRFGGLYADADVTCVRNISSWLPADIWNNDSVHTVFVFPSMQQPVSQHMQCGHRNVSWVLARHQFDGPAQRLCGGQPEPDESLGMVEAVSGTGTLRTSVFVI
jgi:hypothetical protein